MGKQTINSQHTASYSQLEELLSVVANAINANKQSLATKANAASLGAAVTRIAALETLCSQQAETIANMQTKLAYLDNLTLLVTENNNSN